MVVLSGSKTATTSTTAKSSTATIRKTTICCSWNNVRCRLLDENFDVGVSSTALSQPSSPSRQRQHRRQRRQRRHHHHPRRRNRMVAIEIYYAPASGSTSSSSSSTGGDPKKSLFPQQRQQHQQPLNDQDMVYLTVYKKIRINASNNKNKRDNNTKNKNNNRRRVFGGSGGGGGGFGGIRDFVATQNLVGRFFVKSPTGTKTNTPTTNACNDDEKKKKKNGNKNENQNNQQHNGGNDDDQNQGKSISSSIHSDSSSSSSSASSSSSSSSSSSDSDSDSYTGDDNDNDDDIEGSSSIILGASLGPKNGRGSKTAGAAAASAAGTIVNSSTERMKAIVKGALDTALNSSSHRSSSTNKYSRSSNLIRRRKSRGGGGEISNIVKPTHVHKYTTEIDKIIKTESADDSEDEDEIGWIEVYRIRLEEVEALEKRKTKKQTNDLSSRHGGGRGGGERGGGGKSRVWAASFGIGKAKHRGKFVFETVEQREHFHRQFIELKRSIMKRSEQQLQNFKQQQQQQQYEQIRQSKIQTTAATTNVPTNDINSLNNSTISSIRSSITSVIPPPFSSLLVGGTSPSVASQSQTQSQRNRTRIIRSINNGHDQEDQSKRENVVGTVLTSSAITVDTSLETSNRLVQTNTGASKSSSSNSSSVSQKIYGSIIGTPTQSIASAKATTHDSTDGRTPSSTVNSRDVKLLVEIVSASDLPVADQSTTDPYVAVYLGQRLIHTTSPIKNDLNPVWTVETRSLFLISCTAEMFFSHDSGLTFHIIDQDHVTKDDYVASVSISQTKLLEMDGTRESFKLDVPNRIKIKKKNVTRYYKPKLHLRVRRAGDDDIDFMQRLTSSDQSKSEGVNADQSFTAPTKERVGVLRREVKYVDGVKLHRVKPRPDPNRDEQETKWMSSDMIEKETMKPSHSWIEAGTGSLGRMFVEVLKCDDLPNMDLKIPGRPKKGLTDAFCCLIFEDSIVTTDVIRDDLKPRWVPWSQRAFLFNISHPSSQLHIGVFDYDLGLRGIRSHDPIGRISVDVTNLRPGTEYVLSYNLFESILNNDRQPNGTITIRLVFEYDSFRQYALGGVKQLPQINHVNVARKNDFKVAHFVCNGEEDINQFTLRDLIAYQTELESLVVVLYYIRRAVLTVIFWRGHKPIRLFGRKKPFLVPLHSVVAFLLGVTLVENLNLLPSYSLFCVAWFLMATNDYRQKNPSPWHGSMTVMQMWYALVFDITSPETISEYENEAAIKRYEKERKRRQEDEEIHAKTRREAVQQIAELMYSDLTTPIAPDDAAIISNKEDLGSRLRTTPTINPVNRILVQVQKVLRRICRTIRVFKSIILWDESYIAFFIVNVSICVGISIAWVPWNLILRWLGRVVAWLLLGPWMKLVDIYILPTMVDGGDQDEKDEALRKFAVSKIEEVSKAREKFLKKKEEALKHRAMKRYMFGRYATAVPRFKEYRFRDVPLPQSYASPISYDDGNDDGTHGHREVLVSKRTHGQTLVGEMVPTWGDAIH